jgi:hypothetical protein
LHLSKEFFNPDHMKQALIKLAAAWNTLDSTLLEGLLHEDMVYESQWVLQAMEGRQAYMAYLKGKFDTIRKSVVEGNMTVKAELAHRPGNSDEHVIVLSQSSATDEVKVSILVQINEGKISRIIMCAVPDPSAMVLTGIIPNA